MTSSLSERDRSFLWHPYSQHGLESRVFPVVGARGAYLTLEDGREVLDAISSWWVNIHGHSHPRIARAIADQAAKLEHVIFAGFTHEPAVALAEALVGAARESGADPARVFFSDNGSTAVEAALKMAYQFHHNRGAKGRTRFLALRGSYHGDTLGAMAVCEPDGFHSLFKPILCDVAFVPPGDTASFRSLVEREGESIAAFIFEPVIQGAEGMRIYPPEFLGEAFEICRRHGILCIADEVFTGFWRTGRRFAFEHAGIAPDLICVSKGITGGFLPLAATLATREVYEAFLGREMRKAFMHGHSYTANPIACAAALESRKMLEEPACRERVRAISSRTGEWISRLARNPGLREARSLGTIGAVSLDRGKDYFSVNRERILEFALERGVLLRPLGDVIYAVPPYCVTDAELDLIYRTMEEMADAEL